LLRKPKIPPVSGGKIENFLGPGTSFNGTLKSDENIRIDGAYEGRIETAGNVIIGPAAKVVADIVADTIQVWGMVRGNITARSHLEILPDGHVWGDVRVASLLIDEGGAFHGECIMGADGQPLTVISEDGKVSSAEEGPVRGLFDDGESSGETGEGASRRAQSSAT